MYIVLDKITGVRVHENPAPIEQHLTDKEVYFYFDPEIHTIVNDLPEHYKMVAGVPVEKTLQDLVDDGTIILDRGYKVSGDKIVSMEPDEYMTIPEYRDYTVSRIKDFFNMEIANGSFDSITLGIKVDYRRSDIKNDLQNVEALISFMSINSIQSIIYRGFEDLTAPATVSQLEGLVLEMQSHGVMLYNKKYSLLSAASQAETIEEMKNIIW